MTDLAESDGSRLESTEGGAGASWVAIGCLAGYVVLLSLSGQDGLVP
jgi:hypothetical protein